MARPKKQVKIKEPVRIRLKTLKDGNKSIFLDIYSKGVRKYEYLKLYIVPELTPVNKEQNKEAMAIAERIKAERIKSLREHGLEDWNTIKQGSMLLSAWVAKYCEGGIGIKESSLHPRRMMANSLNKYMTQAKRSLITLEEVDADFCRGYIKYLRTFTNSNYKKENAKDHVISQNTSQNYQGLFSTALNKAVRAGIIPQNPMKQLDSKERIQRKDGTKEYLTIEELHKLIETDCYRPEVKTAFLFACFTGLRISDIYAICPMHIFKTPDGKGEYIDMEMKKTEKPVIIPLSKEAKRWLPKPKGDDIPFFDLPTTPSVIARALRKWTESAGIKKHISFHCSRHTFGTLTLAATKDLYTTMRLLGHKDIRTTSIYAEVLMEDKINAVKNTDSEFKTRRRKENLTIPKTKRTAATNTHPRKVIDIQDNG